MKSAGLFFCSFAASAAAEHPIEKVINLLQNLRRTAKDEGRQEELAFTKFSHWCGNEQKSYSKKIAANKEAIETLTDTIDGLRASNEALAEQISKLEKEISDREGDQSKANGIRGDEKSLYDKTLKDLQDTIQAIKDAITGLKSSKNLLQVQRDVKRAAVAAGSILTHEQHKVIRAFLQQPGMSEPAGKGEVAGTGRVRKYDFKSGGVIGLLEQLRDDFQAQELETRKAETNAINAHELAKQGQDAAIKAATDSKDQKKTILAEQKSKLATAEGDRSDETTDLADNEKTLLETESECSLKTKNFEDRTKTRAAEQAAIAQAIEILGKAAGLRSSSHATAVDEHDTITSFVQLSDPRAKAVQLIHNMAKVHHNAALERLAQQVRVSSGPFKQIKNMIQKMVFRLNKEQTDEDNHKNWCDTEIETTQQSLDDKKEHIQKLNADIKGLESRITKLKKDIKEANEAVAQTNEDIKERTDIRQENKKENAQTLSDAKEAQTAVANAIAVLEDFYKSSGGVAKEAWEFLQEPLANTDVGEYAMATGDGASAASSFGGTKGGGNVISVLKTVLEDYTKLESETSSQEETDENLFATFMSESRQTLAEQRQIIKMKTGKMNTAEKNLASTQKQHKKATNQKEALDQYMVDLKPSCIDGDSTYEDRKAARASEIAGLQQALGVLADAFKPKSFLERN